MISYWLTLALTFFSLTTIAQSPILNVSSDDVYQTNIWVDEGADVRIEATGRIVLGPFMGESGPDGISSLGFYNRVLCIGCRHGGLLVKVGDGDWFMAGEEEFFTAEESGKLAFVVNDRDPKNNQGAFNVTVFVNEWLGRLPGCPCEAPEAARVGDGWALDDPSAVQKYHPGADQCFRSYPAVNTPSGDSGQQCCYNAQGELITGGAGAGTPDKESSAEGENSDGTINVWLSNVAYHYTKDVMPFEEMSLTNYLKVWVPNNGNRCPVSNK